MQNPHCKQYTVRAALGYQQSLFSPSGRKQLITGLFTCNHSCYEMHQSGRNRLRSVSRIEGKIIYGPNLPNFSLLKSITSTCFCSDISFFVMMRKVQRYEPYNRGYCRVHGWIR